MYHVYCLDMPIFAIAANIAQYIILEADESVDNDECFKVVARLSKLSENVLKQYFRHETCKVLNHVANSLKITVGNLSSHPLVQMYSFNNANKIDGIYCGQCGIFSYMGTPNRDDGSLICWGCKNGWNG